MPNLSLSNPLNVSYRIGYRHGERTFYGKKHRGVDLIVPTGTPIFSPLNGRVSKIYKARFEGNELKIRNVKDFGSHIESYMCHLQGYAADLQVGNKVKKGDLVGFVGNTGIWTTGPHLHWHLYINNKVADPLLYLEHDNDFAEKFIGKLLLAVEDKGKVWYITKEGKRCEIKVDPKLGNYLAENDLWIGITNVNLHKIPLGFQY